MTIRSSEIHNDPQQQPVKRVTIGSIQGHTVERWFIRALNIGAWLLIVLSVLGTFYGARGQGVPFLTPLSILTAVIEHPIMAALALIGQGLLSLVQWGSRQLAKHDPRWWFVYLPALGLSAYWNWTAWGVPLITMGVPWLLAGGVVVAGDIFPEMTLIREGAQRPTR